MICSCCDYICMATVSANLSCSKKEKEVIVAEALHADMTPVVCWLLIHAPNTSCCISLSMRYVWYSHDHRNLIILAFRMLICVALSQSSLKYFGIVGLSSKCHCVIAFLIPMVLFDIILFSFSHHKSQCFLCCSISKLSTVTPVVNYAWRLVGSYTNLFNFYFIFFLSYRTYATEWCVEADD